MKRNTIFLLACTVCSVALLSFSRNRLPASDEDQSTAGTPAGSSKKPDVYDRPNISATTGSEHLHKSNNQRAAETKNRQSKQSGNSGNSNNSGGTTGSTATSATSRGSSTGSTTM